MGRLLPHKALGTLRMAREIENRINEHRNFVINARREPLQQAANRERAARWALSAANRYLDEAMSAATATVAATNGGLK